MLAHRETPEQAQYHPQYIGPHYLKLLRLKNFAGEEKNAFNKSLIHLVYIYFSCLGVCLLVSNKRQNARTDWPKFCVGLHMSPGQVYG